MEVRGASSQGRSSFRDLGPGPNRLNKKKQIEDQQLKQTTKVVAVSSVRTSADDGFGHYEEQKARVEAANRLVEKNVDAVLHSHQLNELEKRNREYRTARDQQKGMLESQDSLIRHSLGVYSNKLSDAAKRVERKIVDMEYK